jgi:hypothetical protein
VALTPTRKRGEELGTVVQRFERVERFKRFELLARLKMIGSGRLTKQIASYLARTDYEALNDDARDEGTYPLHTRHHFSAVSPSGSKHQRKS